MSESSVVEKPEHQEVLRGMARLRDELLGIEISNLEEYEPDLSSGDGGDDRFTWLYDSNRDYAEQILAYKGIAADDDAAD